MKRLFWLNFLWLAVLILAGWSWSTFDQAAFADRVGHYGLTENAVKITPRKAMNLNEAATALTAADLGPIQVQFHAGGHRIYLYAKGNTGALPLASGQWFSDADLRSPLPVVIVGAQRAAQLRTGSTQQYLRQNGQYVPVLGILKGYAHSQINQVVFENASGAAAKAVTLSQVTIYADSPTIKQQRAKLVQLFGGKATTYHYQSSLSTGWWRDIGAMTLRCLLLAAATVFLAWLASQLTQGLIPTTLATAQRHHTLRRLWTQFFAYSGVDLVLGLLAANWVFDLTNHLRLGVFATGLWILGLAVLYWLLQRNGKQERGKTDGTA